MEIKYKPTKPQKVKPAKAAKPAKTAPIGVGTATAVKIEKPKKVKTPKAPKAPKPEKMQPISFGKAKKVEKAEGVGVLKKSVEPKAIVAIILAVIAIAAIAITVIVRTGIGREEESPYKSISILSAPAKTEYYVGESPSYSGLQVQVVLQGGTKVILEAKDCQISGFDTATAGEKTVTVAYKDLRTSFQITVAEQGSSSQNPGLINGLSFKTLPKTQYKVGEWPSVEGGVLLRHYGDGSTKEIALDHSHLFGFTTQKAGTYTVTVKYMEKGIVCSTTYTITVTK